VEGTGPRFAPVDAFTVGPLCLDVAGLADPTSESIVRLGRTVGFEWIATLVDVDRPEWIGESVLSRFLTERYGLRPGYAINRYGPPRGDAFVVRRPRAIKTELVDTFLLEERGRLADTGQTLARLAAPIRARAEGRTRPFSKEHRRAAELLNALGTTLELRGMSDPVRPQATLFATRLTNLYARCLLELVELYNDTPPLAICARCDRLFIPQRHGQRHCRRYVWRLSDREAVGGCLYDTYPTPIGATAESATRRGEYQRLWLAVARSVERLGADHPESKSKRADFERWKRANPAPRGRRPAPADPDYLLPSRRSERHRRS
jgi:hypothetical protein